MNIASHSTRIGGLVAAVTFAGCAATQSAAFRQMTAADHEQAARGTQDGTGATPADHLEAAQQLRAVEASACTDVPDADRDQGPFAHRGRIAMVEEVKDRVFPKEPLRPFGIAVSLRAEPGLTEQWIARVAQCYVAHHDVVGTTAVNAASPLLLPGVRISVSSTSVGFKVSITTADAATAQEVIAKGHALESDAS
jgi:hypothetical protein